MLDPLVSLVQGPVRGTFASCVTKSCVETVSSPFGSFLIAAVKAPGIPYLRAVTFSPR